MLPSLLLDIDLIFVISFLSTGKAKKYLKKIVTNFIYFRTLINRGADINLYNGKGQRPDDLMMIKIVNNSSTESKIPSVSQNESGSNSQSQPNNYPSLLENQTTTSIDMNRDKHNSLSKLLENFKAKKDFELYCIRELRKTRFEAVSQSIVAGELV